MGMKIETSNVIVVAMSILMAMILGFIILSLVSIDNAPKEGNTLLGFITNVAYIVPYTNIRSKLNTS